MTMTLLANDPLMTSGVWPVGIVVCDPVTWHWPVTRGIDPSGRPWRHYLIDTVLTWPDDDSDSLWRWQYWPGWMTLCITSQQCMCVYWPTVLMTNRMCVLLLANWPNLIIDLVWQWPLINNDNDQYWNNDLQWPGLMTNQWQPYWP